ncbi:hypothetical protein JZ751_028037 [Albula glossodonta]|uniref:DRBM domain-containing protein n=1 Tax=Albula glossodonta TaxID=121402 RepID=A0A8T2PBI1_9TELE|nr:hypothetical protein JZ751_028037 [Albula glossodonta]
MASFSRFNDESYKNWLKTTMSLQILKSSLGSFLENETETYHSSLRNELKGVICKSNCILKKQYSKIDDVCKDCQLWWKEILNNHNNKNGIIYWNNSKPYLWSSEKWEVAKVYMPKGNKDHNTVDQFDISAALNFMTFCSHFKKIVKEQVLKDVTHVRNQMMHSSDMKVAKKDMETHLKKIRELAKVLQDYCPELKDLQEKLIQLQKVDLNIMLEGPDSSREDIIKNILDVQKIQDLEQQVLKEKIECLASRLEEDKEPQRDKEFVGMKEFLDQNKDLLGQLGPQMEKLNTIQVKVEQHDKQLNILTGKVDQLEKNTNEPVFSVDTAKYKNHLFEKARENKWPEPVFENIRKPQGYTGQVVVNGQTFTGYHVHPNVKAAHQEVSMIALEQLSATQEGSSSLHTDQSASSTTSTANPLFFASVKVPVNTAFEGPEADSMEAAVQEAYRSLEQALTLGDTAAGSLSCSAREQIHDFFNQADCKLPEEKPVCSMESTFRCKLQISGDLTFQNPEGMSKKQHAEQAAAKEALDRLSGVLSWDLTGANGNYKGRLQELLAKLGKKPFYQPVAGPSASETSKRGAATERHFDAVPQAAVSVSICETQETSPVYTSPIPSHRKKLKTESACANPTDCQSFAVPELEKLLIMFGLEPPSVSCECFSMETKFQCSAEIHLVNYTFQNQQGYSNKKDATRKTYLIFGKALGICGANIEENQATAAVKTYFNKNLLSLPSEEFFQKEEKTHCSLTVASWSFLFEGQGESEEAAKLDICCQALSVIGPLFGCELASRVSSRSAEERLALMLEVVGQRPPLFQQAATLHKATVQLHFNAFVLESKGQNNKKSAQRQLSMRILRLLGEEETGETSKDVNERNRLDDWFKKKRIPQPIFEDTEEVLGVKATFSCRVTCSHPDWQASTEVAMTRLKEELKRRFRNLADESADHGWSG